MGRELHSIVVPMYNEEAVVAEFRRRLASALADVGDYEVIAVNDGSRDATPRMLRDIAAEDARWRVVHLARNFGHQTAITAGIDLARGDTVTVIDADLQDPPEVVPQLIERWRDGADIVFAVREAREGESFFKRSTASLFYRIMRRLAQVDIPADAGDFRLMSRKATEGLRAMRERSRYIRGLVGWMGLERATVSYRRDARYAGTTKYPLGKMLRLASDGIVSFSTKPLQLATFMGFVSSALGLAYGIWIIVARLTRAVPVQGWSSLMVALLFFGGVQLVTLGIIGEYVGRIYDETRRRPLYLIGEVDGFEGEVREHFERYPTPILAEDGAEEPSAR